MNDHCGDGGGPSTVIAWILGRTLFSVMETLAAILFNFLLSWMAEGEVG